MDIRQILKAPELAQEGEDGSQAPLHDASRYQWLKDFVAGSVAALALPPFSMAPALFAFAWMALSVGRASTPKAAALSAGRFILAFHVIGLHWIAHSMTVDLAKHGWMIPFSVLGLPTYLALYAAFAAYLAKRLAPSGLPNWLAFLGLFSAAEWVRGQVFTGFPWGLPIHGLDAALPLLQLVSVFGSYGASFLVLLVVMSPALFWMSSVFKRQAHGVCALALLVTIASYGWGAARLQTEVPDVVGVALRLVQGNVPQSEKWVPELKPRHVLRYMTLSNPNNPATKTVGGLEPGTPPTVTIWPEMAVAYLVNREPDILKAFRSAIPKDGSLLFGGPAIEGDGDNAQPLNSLYVVEETGSISQRFDKFHLVPFGEYMPLRGILPVDAIAASGRDFAAGLGPVSLTFKGAPSTSPLICYEAIFPGEVASRQERPHWLLNITNDAWFGRFSGPYQHLANARLRAIEEGLPLIRVANTGVTAVFDVFGREYGRLEVGETGVLDSALPGRVSPTIYNLSKEILFIFMVICSFALSYTVTRFKK